MPRRYKRPEPPKTEKEIFEELYIGSHSSKITATTFKSKILKFIDKISVTEAEEKANLGIINYFIKKELVPEYRSAYIERFIQILELREKLTKFGAENYKLDSRLLNNLKKSIDIINKHSRFEKVTHALDSIMLDYHNKYQNIIEGLY